MELTADAVTVEIDLVASALAVCRTLAKATKDAPLAGAVRLRTVSGRLEFYSTDAKHAVRVSAHCEGELGADCAVPLGRLADLVATASKRQGKRAPSVGLELKEGGSKLAVQVPGRYFELATLDGSAMEEAASVAEDATEVVYGMPTELREALEFAIPAAAAEKDGPVLGGVLIVGDVLAATNGHHIHSTGAFPTLARPRGATLPTTAAKALVAALKQVQPARVVGRYDDGAAVFFFHMEGRGGLDVALTAKAPGEQLPNLSNLLKPLKGVAVLELATAAFGDAMKLAARTAALKGTCVLVADKEQGTLTVHAAEEDGARCDEILKAQVSGVVEEPVRFVLNAHYALLGTTALGPRMRLEVHQDKEQPIHFLGENPRRVALVMRAERDSNEPMVEASVTAAASSEKPEAME